MTGNLSWMPPILKSKMDTFYDIIQQQLDNPFPVKRLKRSSTDKPWMTCRIKRLLVKRQRAFSRGHDRLWRFYRNSVARAITNAKKDFAASKLAQAHKEPSSWYKIAIHLSGCRQKKSSINIPGLSDLTTGDLAVAINSHFTAINRSLPPLDRSRLPVYVPAGPAPPVTRSQMWRELSKIKVSTSPAPDQLPNNIVKEFAFELSIPLTNILNTSLRSGVVPAQWKFATVVPLPKVIPTPSFDKLRPISLTSTLSKVCESFIIRWMLQNMGPTLDCAQYGNRRGRSTIHYLVDLVQFVLREAERGRYVNLLAIDFSKAFDKVDETVAVQKLLDMNVRRELLPWIADFLSNRQQCVRLSSHITGRTFTTCGVRQGTKVGPVVFLAMVNQVAVDKPQRWKYVDDITVGESCAPRTPPTSGLQQAMDGISRFTPDNHMTLNVDKCGTMQCSFARGRPPQLDITSNGRRVSNLSSMGPPRSHHCSLAVLGTSCGVGHLQGQ